jgi:hypothetical protein
MAYPILSGASFYRLENLLDKFTRQFVGKEDFLVGYIPGLQFLGDKVFVLSTDVPERVPG